MRLLCVPWGVIITRSCFAVLRPVVSNAKENNSSQHFWTVGHVWIRPRHCHGEEGEGTLDPRLDSSLPHPPTAPPPPQWGHEDLDMAKVTTITKSFGHGGMRKYQFPEVHNWSSEQQPPNDVTRSIRKRGMITTHYEDKIITSPTIGPTA